MENRGVTQPSVLEIREPGTYGIVLECRRAGRVSVGRLGTLPLEPGWYVYVGSGAVPVEFQ